MRDILDSLADIYDAIGDADRWRQIEQRFAESSKHDPELAHHFELARRTHFQHVNLTSAVETLAGLHNHLALGALVVDNEGELVRANAAASRLLADEGGLRLTNGRVEAINSAEQGTLLAAIAAACGDGPDGDVFVMLTRPARARLCVVVLPTDNRVATVFEKGLLALLLLVNTDATRIAGAAVLRALFDFTAREAEVATRLMEGHTIEEAATMLGISVATARTFLARLTAKTDSNSQPELLRRLLAIPPVR